MPGTIRSSTLVNGFDGGAGLACRRARARSADSFLLQLGGDERELGPGVPLVERDGPLHPLDAADAVEVVLEHRLDVVDEPDAGVHDPEVGPGDVGDLGAGPEHQAAEDRPLLRDQARRRTSGPGRSRGTWPCRRPASSRRSRTWTSPHDSRKRRCFRSHDGFPGLDSAQAPGPGPPGRTSVMWSVRYSRSSARYPSAPISRSVIAPGHLVVQALADHAEGQDIQPAVVGLGADLRHDPLQPLEPRPDRLADQDLGDRRRGEHLPEHQAMLPVFRMVHRQHAGPGSDG